MTRVRLASALVMGPLAILAILFLPTSWMAVVAAVLFMGGLWEWFNLAEVEDTLARLVLVALNLLLLVALVWGSHSRAGGTAAIFNVMIMAGVAWWVASLLWLRRFEFGSHHEGWARAFKLLAATLAVLPAWCALVVLHAGDELGRHAHGLWPIPKGHLWLLAALVTVWAADSGAYFAGRRFGRHKLSPRISPNKTLEGLAGGLLLGMVAGMGVASLTGLGWAGLPAVALTCFVTVLASVVGDLFESLLKRHAGMKDSGDLIPGHGGILDRIDSVLAALPVFALMKQLLGL